MSKPSSIRTNEPVAEPEPEVVEETAVEEAVEEGPEPAEDALAELPEEGQDIDLSTEGDEDTDSEDSLTFSNGVIEKIVAIAMREVPGVVGMKGSWFRTPSARATPPRASPSR